jgi:hypothetical protein
VIFERQRLLLTLLDAIGGPVNNTDFQKLLFLFTRECEHAPTYEFVPHKVGAFSFTADADKRRLTEAGLLVDDGQRWQLTESGRQIAREKAANPLPVVRFCRKQARLRGDALSADQYRRYPYYATRSEFVENLKLEPEARRRIIEARPAKIGPGLFTIGYEGKSVERYLNQLLQSGVTLLCDVRRNPLSRKYGFSKRVLSKACEDLGIRYEHLPELGIASEKRRNLETQVDYDALFAIYEREELPKQGQALVKIRAWIEEGAAVALTCFEAQPSRCHRHCVAESLEKMIGKAAVHL